MPKPPKLALCALPLMLSLMMAGCGQPLPSAPATPEHSAASPAPQARTQVGQLYELQFRRDGQGGPVTSSISVPGQLSAQATRLVDNQLAFSYVSSGTLHQDGQWFVRVTYHVTNTSAQTITNLGLVPLDTDAVAGATPTISPTVGSTYFKDVKHFDGSDAADQAASLVPGQARDASGQVDTAATPYQPIDTAGQTIALPAGLQLGKGGLSPSGWQTSGVLAPGASTDVTFATQMPATSGTTDPFFYTVVFTAVGSVDVPVTLTPTPGANSKVKLPASSPAYVSGTLGDPTDPASVQGLTFTVADSDADAAGLTVTATSSNPSVGAATLSGSGKTRLLKISPRQAGYADITVTVADGDRASASYVVHYAASQAAGTTSSTRFFSGASNASSAQEVGDGYMMVADDEFNALSLYPQAASSAPVAQFDFSSLMNLTDTANPEMDLEASARLGNRIFWMGSQSNSKSGKARPNRNRVFATDLRGTGAATTLNFVGSYDHLRDDLLAWDRANGNALGLGASAASGVIPEADGGVGYNIEGLAFKPGSSVAYLGFRAPLEPSGTRNAALIVPVTNFTELVTGTARTATFGAPVQLDLGGRGIRELKCNDQGCLILAGPASGGSSFALYSWNGQSDGAAHLRNDLQALATSMDGSLESIVTMPAGNPDSDALTGQPVQVLTDNGDSVYYGDGKIAKDLVAPAQDWQKFRAETVIVGALPAQTCTVSNLSVTPDNSTLPVGGTQTFKATYTTSPPNCAVNVSWSSSDPSKLTVDERGVARAEAAGTVTLTATVTPGNGTPVSASTGVTVSAPVTSLPNVAVYRVGDGSAKLTSAATPVFVDIINPNDGSLVRTLSLPTSASGSNRPLLASGTASSEGLLSRSADAHYLVLTGYAASVGLANVKASDSATTPRVIGRLDSAGTVDTSTTVPDAYSGDNVRSAASTDGRSFYVTGGNSGVRLYALGASSGLSVSSAVPNLRQLGIFGDQLYVSSGSGNGTKGLLSVGNGLPTTGNQTVSRLPGLSDSVTGDSYGFFWADLDGLPGADTLYIADATSGLQKFSLQNGTWVASGVASGSYSGLTGVQQGNTVTLLATNAGGLVKLTDTSGFLKSLSGTPTLLSSAKANTALRGVALAPLP